MLLINLGLGEGQVFLFIKILCKAFIKFIYFDPPVYAGTGKKVCVGGGGCWCVNLFQCSPLVQTRSLAMDSDWDQAENQYETGSRLGPDSVSDQVQIQFLISSKFKSFKSNKEQKDYSWYKPNFVATRLVSDRLQIQLHDSSRFKHIAVGAQKTQTFGNNQHPSQSHFFLVY